MDLQRLMHYAITSVYEVDIEGVSLAHLLVLLIELTAVLWGLLLCSLFSIISKRNDGDSGSAFDSGLFRRKATVNMLRGGLSSPIRHPAAAPRPEMPD
jgi:hypothetical protein